MEFFIKKSELEIGERKLDAFLQYCKIIQWGRSNPIKFAERFYGVTLMDHQKYTIANTWTSHEAVWCASRGSGKSTMGSIYIQLRTDLFPNNRVFILAPVGKQSKETFEKIEKITKKEISQMRGLTDFYSGEIVKANNKVSGFIHSPDSYSYKLYNGSRVHTLNSIPENIRGMRSELNFYDEAGFIPDEIIRASHPFLAADSDFATGIDPALLELIPKNMYNQAIYASSASDMSSIFYDKYKSCGKHMMMGIKGYFVVDLNIDISLRPTVNGKLIKSQTDIKTFEKDMANDRENAMREYYNQFVQDGGDSQPIKLTKLNSLSIARLPELRRKEHFNGHYVFAFDPALNADNSVIIVAKVIKDDDMRVGYRMEIVNCIALNDHANKNKTQLSTQAQLEAIQNLILNYNGRDALDYEYIKGFMIDKGSGGGGEHMAFLMQANWIGIDGKLHKGLIDGETHAHHIANYPEAIDIVRLISPQKKAEMYDALVEGINDGLITFTEEYDGNGTINVCEEVILDHYYEYEDNFGQIHKTNIEKNYKTINLSKEEEMALMQIDLTKNELTKIYKYKQNNGVRYDLAKEYANKMHDDRAYCMALLGYYFKLLRRDARIEATITSTSYSSAPIFVNAVSFD